MAFYCKKAGYRRSVSTETGLNDQARTWCIEATSGFLQRQMDLREPSGRPVHSTSKRFCWEPRISFLQRPLCDRSYPTDGSGRVVSSRGGGLEITMLWPGDSVGKRRRGRCGTEILRCKERYSTEMLWCRGRYGIEILRWNRWTGLHCTPPACPLSPLLQAAGSMEHSLAGRLASELQQSGT